MAQKIVVSYRAEDTARHAALLFDRLRQALPGRVFLRGGNDSGISDAAALLVMIGPAWLTGSWLTDPQDSVRREIAAALSNNLPVIPVLVRGAALPDPDELPADIAGLADVDPITLRDTDWEYDCEQMFPELKSILLEARVRQFAPWVLRASAAILAVVFLTWGVTAYLHNRRLAAEAQQDAADRLASLAETDNKPVMLTKTPAGLTETRWEGPVTLEDRNVRKFDQTARFHFHERTVDIETYAVSRALGTSRVGCLVSSDGAEMLIACPMVHDSLMPVTYRLKLGKDELTGVVAFYCDPAQAKDLCPDSGMLFYDVALKRAPDESDTDLAQELRRRWRQK